MKKCPACGLENPDEGLKCQSCQAALSTASETFPLPHPKPLRRFLPWFLSYFIVASGVFLFNHVMGELNQVPFPPHFVVLNTSLSPNELIAKLAQAGVPKESLLGALAPQRAVGPALLHHFILFGVSFLAFALLAKLFKRLFTN